MGVFSRLNDAKRKLDDAENAMPGAYDNRYDQGIQDALSAMGSQNSTGVSTDAVSSIYNDAMKQLTGNAAAGAQQAAQTANALSGGYGAGYAESAAQQAAAGQTGSGSAMAKARATALQQWQQELSGQNSLLDTLLGQDSLARSEYDGSVSNAENWRSYLYDRTQQARQETDDFMSNVWNTVKGVGSTLRQGYDAYMGYSQQKLANQTAGYQLAAEYFEAGDEEKAKQVMDMYGLDSSLVENWKESYATRQNKASSIQTAIGYMKAGSPEAAKEALRLSGLDETLLDNWQGMTDYEKDQLDAALNAMSAAGSGNDTGADTILKLAGMDGSVIDDYATVMGRQNQNELTQTEALNKLNLSNYESQLKLNNKYNLAYQQQLLPLQRQYSSTKGSGTKSTGSSGSKNTKAAHTDAQYNTMYTQWSKMKPGDEGYDYLTNELADGGRINRLSGTGNPGKANGTPYEQGMYKARQLANSGSSQSQIAAALANGTGLSNDQITAIMNQIDYEWRGTK